MKKILAVTAAFLFVLSGCANSSGSGEDAKATLVDSLRNLLEADALTQTITVDSDVDSLVAVSDGEIDEEVASTILESSLTASGTQAEDPADASSVMVLNLGGSEDFEMRFVEGDLYVRADVPDLLETFGQDSKEIDSLAARVEGQKGFEWVDDALAGEWVMVRDAVALIQQFGGAGGAAPSVEQQRQMINDLLESVEKNASVTSEGEDADGTHVRAGLPIKATVEDLVKALGPGTGMAGAGMQDALNDIPEGDVVIDFWIDDDRVTRIELDVTQFEQMAEDSDDFPKDVEELAVVVELEEFEGTVEPVADAVEIDTTSLTQALSGLMTGAAGMGAGAGAPSGSAFDCSMLKGAPPEVVELYAKECPELQK